ncbi:transcriptional regulator [Streptomyces sp. NBC_01016]|uniref:AfsR/SARP family transcriptional regulator n=1 Tax=Streptomyces sp. NBC_01016 TaxID=2903720 RepID=UPI00224DE46D|nr:BTAD domain-containing putative transcriptional regulator [Streptomyces sp. NBC_01016]MCX4834677.1 transcriptional regulator [Streptomyces sp. NBC_01016]
METSFPAGLALGLLSGFRLTTGAGRTSVVPGAQRLIALLALQERPLSRACVADALWPSGRPDRAGANLRSCLWRVNRRCGPLIETSAQHLSLADGVAVDVRAVSRQAHRLLEGPDPCEDCLTAATLADLSLDVLPDWYDEWVLVEREQFHQLRLHALEAMSGRLVAVGRYGVAVDAGLAAVRAEPLRESSHRAVIRAHLAAGNDWEAARQYVRCCRALHRELGIEPSPALRRLVPFRDSTLMLLR